MKIIKNRQIIDNPWRLEAESPNQRELLDGDSQRVLVSLTYWLENRHNLKDHAADIGIFLNPDEEVSTIANELDTIPVIALLFENFSEGRGYSQAAELRDQYNYCGEIRALGASIDNLLLMERCGINAFQFNEDENLELALSYFTEIETVYPYNPGSTIHLDHLGK